jgi:hypothetical protein
MNVSSDALTTKENDDEHTGNDTDRNTEEGEGQQEIRKGNEARETKEGREDSKSEKHSIWKQGREGPGTDEAKGRRDACGNRKGDRLAESQHSRVRQWAHSEEARPEGRVHEERGGGEDLPDR